MRNYLYDKSILKSYQPLIPVIVVGNLIAGGTGKTPVVAWVARKLSEKYRVAILSRGYGRRTGGFQLLSPGSTPETVGDEPMELQLLLPETLIAVDRNRKRGIQNLTSGLFGKIDVIIMDDGFQHRRVKPGFSIILDDFNRPVRKEKLLPAGLRREPLAGLKRATLIIQTKEQAPSVDLPASSRILLITGIANPQPLADEISKTGRLSHHRRFPDHHRYTQPEAESIRNQYFKLLDEARPGSGMDTPIILTTGKDYVKLIRFDELKGLPLQMIPYGPPVQTGQKQEIIQKILQYVEEANRNR